MAGKTGRQRRGLLCVTSKEKTCRIRHIARTREDEASHKNKDEIAHKNRKVVNRNFSRFFAFFRKI
jgi:hypothetical protein